MATGGGSGGAGGGSGEAPGEKVKRERAPSVKNYISNENIVVEALGGEGQKPNEVMDVLVGVVISVILHKLQMATAKTKFHITAIPQDARGGDGGYWYAYKVSVNISDARINGNHVGMGASGTHRKAMVEALRSAFTATGFAF